MLGASVTHGARHHSGRALGIETTADETHAYAEPKWALAVDMSSYE